jgi:lipopolysaccharide/colanic/teichoic acid biosynthesis glycosyltransferase
MKTDLLNSESLSYSNREYRKVKYHPLRVFVTKKKIKCIVINPGRFSSVLLKDKKFKNSYSFDFLSTDDFINEFEPALEYIKTFDIVLIDQSNNVPIGQDILGSINELKVEDIKLFNIVSFYENVTGRVPIIHYDQGWEFKDDLFYVTQRKHFEFVKRLFDLFWVALLFLPAFVLISIAALLIKVSSPGPILFRQKRMGKNGKAFIIYKLRTMEHTKRRYAEFTVENDQRIFPLGKIFRKLKIDELPQLLNVLRGEMSVIGPRPERVDIVKEMSYVNPYFNLRHAVKPGITGWAQVNFPKATPDDNLIKLEYDLYYIKHTSYFLELKIYWYTIKVILKRDSL